MQHHDSNVVVPINYVLFTISAIVSGVLFYHEFTGLSSVNIFMFLFGCFLSFVAVYFISANREEHGTKNRMSCTVTNPNVQDSMPCLDIRSVQPHAPNGGKSDDLLLPLLTLMEDKTISSYGSSDKK
uniref:NIPA-like protein 2-like n=1 Tax=Saccoglossus kowalevskii TaxID=10224 RepID=A0ABM0M0Z1_SACKO|nr:PREDICTED: NIPA-like protein 2-like [Saccoglossus kowalevskii]